MGWFIGLAIFFVLLFAYAWRASSPERLIAHIMEEQLNERDKDKGIFWTVRLRRKPRPTKRVPHD